MVSEPDTGRCVSLLVVPRKRVDTKWCVSKDAGPKGGGFRGGPTSIEGRKECQRGPWPRRGWIMMSHIGWGGEQITLYKSVETFP